MMLVLVKLILLCVRMATVTVDAFKDAAWNGDFDTVKSYVEAGGDVNVCASNGVNALVSFHIPILDYLLEHGADPHGLWSDGNPPFCFHVWEVNIETIRWFLNKGIDVNCAHQQTGENALHSLCAKPVDCEERLEAIKLLFEYDVDVNAQTAVGFETGNFMRDVCVVGETALHRAAAYQPYETIEYLLSKGADQTIKDARGESPLSWASRHWRDRATLKLLQYGSYEGTL